MNDGTLTDLDNRHAGLPCYIIGKGPSLDKLVRSHFREGCPVIAINESIARIETILPESFPIYSLQQDGKAVCMRRPRDSTSLLLTYCGRHRPPPTDPAAMPCCSQHHFPDHPRRILYHQAQLGLRPDIASSESAIAIARRMGCSHIVIVAHDACVTGSVDYCTSLGELHYEDGNPSAYRSHARRIARLLIDTPHSYLTPGHVDEPEPVTVITPTGDRPELMRICRDYVNRQTRFPAQWIVVDDGETPLPEDLRRGCTYIRREPGAGDPAHTLPMNLLAALPEVRHKRVAIIEDDDWYSANYLETFVPYLDHFQLVGETRTVYYHVPRRMYRRCGNETHASLCQTMFTREAFPALSRVCDENAARGDFHVDLDLWKSGLRYRLATTGDPYVVGLKGLPGRRGQSSGHAPSEHMYKHDPAGQRLAAWIGLDAKRYARWSPVPVAPATTQLSCELQDTGASIPDLCEVIKTMYGLSSRIGASEGDPVFENELYELALSILKARLEKEAT